MSVGERIFQLRKERGLSQGQLSQMLGVSRQAVCKWENDQSSPDTLNLIRLADALNTTVEYLATGKKSSSSPALHAPIQVNLIQNEEKIVEVEKIVEITVVKRRVLVKHIRNPLEYVAVGLICLAFGFLLALLLL